MHPVYRPDKDIPGCQRKVAITAGVSASTLPLPEKGGR
jgi:hypothetical protein